MHFACDRVRPSHAFFAPLLEPAIPNFCARLFVVTLRPHVMNLVVETDNLVDGQRQRPKSSSDSFDNMFSPTSRIMRAAREKTAQTSQRLPCASSQSTVPMFALVSEARWASLSPQVPHASSKPSLLWPPRSMPQSCRLKGNRTQHLHRLQVASVASGLSQSVPLVSFMPVSVDPSVSSTIFGLFDIHISLSHARGKTKHVLHVAAVKHGACESDTEPRLHLRLAEPLVTAMSIILWLLFVEKSSPGTASRSLIVGHPSGHKLCFFIQYTDGLLVGDCFGRKKRIPASCLEEAPWDALTTSILKHLVNGSLRTTSSHTFNKPRNGWKHPNTNIKVNNNR